MSDRSECAMGFCYRKPDPGSLFCERHKETEALRARIAELIGALERASGLLTRMCKYAVEDRAFTPGSTRLARIILEARRYLGELPTPPDLARPSTGGGATPTVCAECKCATWILDINPVHAPACPHYQTSNRNATPADLGRLDPVEAILAVECSEHDHKPGGPCDKYNSLRMFCEARIRAAEARK